MTMPGERMRALCWAEQLLREMQVDPLGSPEMKHRAAELSRGYPSQARLLQILSGPGARIPPGIATVGFNAGWLLEAKNLLGQVGGTTTRPMS
jgi:hypothetical protein